MLELETPLPVLHHYTTHLVAEMNKEYTLKQSIIKKPGLILFGVNPSDWTAYQVPIKSKATMSFVKAAKVKNYINPFLYPNQSKEARLGAEITHKADYDPNAIYIWALNEKNAIRKVKRDFEAFIKRLEEQRG